MALTTKQKLSIMAETSDEREICLITMTHPTFDQPIRISTDPTQYLQDDEDTGTPIYGTISNGKTYYYLPIQATLPSSETEKAPVATFSISNVSQMLAPYLMKIEDEYPRVTIDMVMASDVNSVFQTWPEFDLKDATLDANTASLSIALSNAESEAIPWLRFTPAYFPNLFTV